MEINETTDNGLPSTGEASAFAKSGKLQRSPMRNQATPAGSNRSKSVGERSGQGTVLSHLLTPMHSGRASRDAMAEVRAKVDELHEFVKDRHNVHSQIKLLVTSIKTAVAAAEREQKQLRTRGETAEKALSEAVKKRPAEMQGTPEGPNSQPDKRKRETPGEEEERKKAKNDSEAGPSQNDSSGWRTVGKKVPKPNQAKKEEVRKKPRPRRERIKGDALIIAANADVSYAAILRKVREAPELKGLGEKVVRTRRTQNGEMLFELQKDPSVKSAAFKELVANALGHEAKVKALTQETTVECRDLDEITTEEELRSALKEQCNLGDEPMVIRLRKAYGGTQTAAIRLSAAVAPNCSGKAKSRSGGQCAHSKPPPA